MSTEILCELFGARSVTEEKGGYTLHFREIARGNTKIFASAFVSSEADPEENIKAIREARESLSREMAAWDGHDWSST